LWLQRAGLALFSLFVSGASMMQDYELRNWHELVSRITSVIIDLRTSLRNDLLAIGNTMVRENRKLRGDLHRIAYTLEAIEGALQQPAQFRAHFDAAGQEEKMKIDDDGEVIDLGSPGGENMLAFLAMGTALAIDVNQDMKFAGLFIGVLSAQISPAVWNRALRFTRELYERKRKK
jgi:hypothetical protein